MMDWRPFYRVWAYLIAIHVLCLIAMSVCRVVLLLSNLPAEGVDWTLLPTALVIGVKFDNLIACYLSALPMIAMPVVAICLMGRNAYAKVMQQMARGVRDYYAVVYALVLFVEVANARYYHFFENHLNISVTEWFGFVGDTAGLVLGDTINWVFIAVAAVVISAYIWALRVITKRYSSTLI